MLGDRCDRSVACEARTRAARVPHVLTLSARRIVRRNLPEAVVPYLRMSGRWLEEHGFAIGSGVRVVVERGRVTLISDAVEKAAADLVREIEQARRAPAS